jgi:hypothetical protein
MTTDNENPCLSPHKHAIGCNCRITQLEEEQYKKILIEKYPMLTFLVYGGNEYFGIIQNVDDILTTMYDYGVLKTNEQKINFLTLADIWWNESNRQICPINIFLRQEWECFRFTLKTFNSKEVQIKHGPYLSLKEMASKRSKKRCITLVKRIP